MNPQGSDITKQVAKQITNMNKGITSCQTAQSNLNLSYSVIRDTIKKLQGERDQWYITLKNNLKKEKVNYLELATRFNVMQERVEQDHVEFSTSQKFAKDQRNSLEVRVQELEIGLITAITEIKNQKTAIQIQVLLSC